MAWSFSAEKPVYLQIAERITVSILSGKYSPSEQIPSVRQLALEAAVNPNTVQHAFSELEDEGIIVSKGTQGRFVTEEIQIIESCRKKLVKQLFNDFVTKSKELSVTKEELLSIVEEMEL